MSLRFPLKLLTDIDLVGSVTTVYGRAIRSSPPSRPPWGLSAVQAATLLMISRLVSIVASSPPVPGWTATALVSARRTRLC